MKIVRNSHFVNKRKKEKEKKEKKGNHPRLIELYLTSSERDG